MQEAQKASEEARLKLAEIESRLQKLDTEIGMIRDAAEKEGAAEEARIKAAALEDARKIVNSAEQEISAAAKSARRQLTSYAADLAVGLAQKQIRVDPGDRSGPGSQLCRTVGRILRKFTKGRELGCGFCR